VLPVDVVVPKQLVASTRTIDAKCVDDDPRSVALHRDTKNPYGASAERTNLEAVSGVRNAKSCVGRGGFGGPKQTDLKRLEELAKKKLRESTETERKNVFISFIHEDIKNVNLLRAQAKNENSSLEFNDWSLREPFDSKRADYIKQGIRERIRQSSVTLVYISGNTATSKWVDWEIRESVALGKKVVAVYQGKVPSKLPPAINENKIKLIKWSHKRISKELE